MPLSKQAGACWVIAAEHLGRRLTTFFSKENKFSGGYCSFIMSDRPVSQPDNRRFSTAIVAKCPANVKFTEELLKFVLIIEESL